MDKVEFERKIGRRTYRVLGQQDQGKITIRVFVETPARIRGQEVHQQFFYASEWLEFQAYAERMFTGVA
jgi:hypothetical protein